MYSTLAASTDADTFDDSSFLFNQPSDDILSMTHDRTLVKAATAHAFADSGFSDIVPGPYSESTPSSIHYGDAHETSEMGSREERDESLSSSHLNGQEPTHAPSPLHYPHPIYSARPNEGSQNVNCNTTTKLNGENVASSLKHMALSAGTTVLSPTSKSGATNGFPMARSLSATLPKSQSSSTPERSFSPLKGKAADLKTSSSIPATMSWEEFARQSILAAESSRLNPFSLHPEEYRLLRNHITPTQVTTYLNIRNGILRLWTHNPLVNVSWEEAAGCARERRYFSLAKVAYHWLLRNGYINFGCVEVNNTANPIPRNKAKVGQRTVVVVGAGMSGLGCARHLEGLFAQLGSTWTDNGEQPPKVIVLEARPRVGGRVYSHPLRDQSSLTLPPGHRCTAEMGAQIVTGFEHGNPLNALIRGQLGIPYHGLRDNTVLYDHDGTVVERSQDMLVEKLYNDVLERASTYRNKPAAFRTVEGDRNLILFGRDPNDIGGPTIASLENSNTPLPANGTIAASTTEEKPSSGVEKLAGRAYQLTAGFNPNITAAEAAVAMGWQLKPGVTSSQTLDLDTAASVSEFPTLGQTMDDGIKQYQTLLDIKPKDMRLLSWHHANLEYANAVSVNQLSLSGWDQDIGNEFEGEHTEIVGGYQQVPRGLWQCPGKLDVRFKSVVREIRHNAQERRVGKAIQIACVNGDVIEADHIVLTTPLGVLKAGSIDFQPPLPDWKQGVIQRMGFGLLNKVILVYDKPFWEPNRDMFGLLNEAEQRESLNPSDYTSRRGRFYLFWNCIKTSGKAMLVALMAGDAAHYAEATPNDQLVKEVTGRLAKMFAPAHVPVPSETIVTQWSKDPFACGSYSFVGSKTQAGDYDVMANPCGPVHFAGEATCGTHPATVHGAYLSGLRAAAEVVEAMIGPISVPSPLVEKKVKTEQLPSNPSVKPKIESNGVSPITVMKRQLHDEDYEASIIGAILSEIGERPLKPGRTGVNPFLLYTKDYWHICKKECDEKRRVTTGDPNAKASKTEIRTALGLMWRTASIETKQPYLDQTQNAKDDAAANAETFKERVATWDCEADRIRREYIEKNPPPQGSVDHMVSGRTAIEMGGGKRLRRS